MSITSDMKWKRHVQVTDSTIFKFISSTYVLQGLIIILYSIPRIHISNY